MMFLPGVPVVAIRDAYARAPGNEIASRRFAHPGSSAALAANGIGWFLNRPTLLPCFPGLDDLDWSVTALSIEQEVRFPWSGGRHAWLDAVVTTPTYLIGIESKRLEPFRDAKLAAFSSTYDHVDWGNGMVPWTMARDRLRADPALFYLYAEPPAVDGTAIERHRQEVATFDSMITRADVRFVPCRWVDWLTTFAGEARDHAVRVSEAFRL